MIASRHTVCGAILKKCAAVPLYQPKNPSVRNVFQRQSIGFLYNVPYVRPLGPMAVGSAGNSRSARYASSRASVQMLLRLYIRVKAWNRNARIHEYRGRMICLLGQPKRACPLRSRYLQVASLCIHITPKLNSTPDKCNMICRP